MKVKRRTVKLKTTGKRKTFFSKQGWRLIAGRNIYFRSEWEVKVAGFLQLLKERNAIKEWEHEPKTFWFNEIKRGTRSYLPDFKIIRPDDSHYWIEVKGYMDAKSKTKIKRFKKYYPQEQLFVLGEEWFKKNSGMLKHEN